MKRTILPLAMALILSACSGGSSSPATGNATPITPPTQQVAQSALARDANPQVSAADLAAVVAGNTSFALNTFPLLDPSSSSNTVFSPYSITQALALAAAGANGNTLSGIEQALSFTLPQSRLNPALNKFSQLLASEATGATISGQQLPSLNISNAIWAQQGLTLNQTYLDTLAVNFGAGLQLLDFIDAPDPSRVTINAWVAQQTDNRITNLLSPGSITPVTRVVLTNTIWFKANWQTPFSTAATQNQPFIGLTGSSSSVPFMGGVQTLPYTQSDGCQAVDIAYAGGQLSMLVLMPTAGTFDSFLSSLTPATLADITNRLSGTYLALSLPKFNFSTTPNVQTVLQSLGMTDAFEPGVADFSGIDGQRDLFISGIGHQAFISIDENGTEAAAATYVGIATSVISANPPTPLTLTINHPFLFLLRDVQTGAILFMGKVVSP